MVDTHCHLTLCDDDPAAVVGRAADAGVNRLLTVGLGEDSNPDAVALAREIPGVFAAVGRHPNSAAGFDATAAGAIEELAGDPVVRAVGETGLDFYRDGAPREDQRRAFRAQIEIARRVGKPVVIHMRSGEGDGNDAVGETLELLAAEADGVDVILHCFGGSAEQARLAAERGWYCSFAGNVTYPKADGLREAAAVVTDGLLLVETDSPFLPPQSTRGSQNEPARVVETAGVVAEARGVSIGELEALVEANAERVLGW